MMTKIIHRYILKETLIYFSLAMLIFTFVLLSGNLLKLSDLIINKGVSFGVMCKLLLYFIPYLIVYTLPMSLLASVLITFGKLAQDNEFTALRACGISIFRIIAPVLAFALGISIFAATVNIPFVAKAHLRMRIALVNLGFENPQALIEPGKFIDTFDKYTFYIKDINGNKLKQIIIYEALANNAVRTITSEEGFLSISPDKQSIILHLINGTADEPDPANPQKFYKMQFKSFPIIMTMQNNNNEKDFKYKSLKEMTLGEIRQEAVWTKAQGLPIFKHFTEYHRKLSFSFAGFILALLGIPLALQTRSGDKSASIGYTLILTSGYYVLYIMAKAFAEEGHVAPWLAMWSPNIIFGSLGLVLLYRVQRM